MKKLFLFILLFSLLAIFNTGCSVMEGRPENANIDQAKGSSVWWQERQNQEINAEQLNDQFGDQPSNQNQSYMDQDAIDMDEQHFNF